MTALMVSNVALLGVLAALGVALMALARQIGIIHERTAPAGMVQKPAAPSAGDPLIVTAALNALGTAVDVPGDRAVSMLFVGAECPVCRAVLPVFDAAPQDPDESRFWATDGSGDVAAFSEREHIPPERLLVSTELALALGVRQLPTLVRLRPGHVIESIQAITGPGSLSAALGGGNRVPASAEQPGAHTVGHWSPPARGSRRPRQPTNETGEDS